MGKEVSTTGGSTAPGERILAVTEEELQRLILDLHDGPVQQLFAAHSQLTALQTHLARGHTIADGQAGVTLGRISHALEDALREIRQFLGAFRPPDFAHQDLVHILQGLLMHYELSSGVEVAFFFPSETVEVSLPTKIALYRICQEALSNGLRHAAGRGQSVNLAILDNGWLHLRVCDQGPGFVPPPLHGPQGTEREEHIGLRGMRDRVELVGGRFELHSHPGRGTCIDVHVPSGRTGRKAESP